MELLSTPGCVGSVGVGSDHARQEVHILRAHSLWPSVQCVGWQPEGVRGEVGGINYNADKHTCVDIAEAVKSAAGEGGAQDEGIIVQWPNDYEGKRNKHVARVQARLQLLLRAKLQM